MPPIRSPTIALPARKRSTLAPKNEGMLSTETLLLTAAFEFLSWRYPAGLSVSDQAARSIGSPLRRTSGTTFDKNSPQGGLLAFTGRTSGSKGLTRG